jgi:hypothetical protein
MDLFPNEVLLDIFDSYVNTEDSDAWHTLIHVCQRWRSIVLSSPRRLNLRIFCTTTRPVTKMLDIWPAFPIVVWYDDPWPNVHRVNNIVAALEHPDRVREIRFEAISSLTLMAVKGAMEVPFPVLTTLKLRISCVVNLPSEYLPNPFLGGSAPRLQSLDLTFIPFHRIRELLLSANDLVHLSLAFKTHRSVPPDEIATCLSSMAKLESISLAFKSYAQQHPPYQAGQRPSPLSRVIFPALTYFGFQGAAGYLEDLMACLNAPLLDGVTLINPVLPRFV